MAVDKTNTTTDVSADELLRQVDALPEAERLKIVYELVSDAEWDRIKEWSVSIIDWIDSKGIVNKHSEQRSDLVPLVAMMHTASLLMKQTFAHQARLEMQHQNEDTQWGMQLADAVSDLSTNICEDAEKIASMVAHYAAVLHGRRIGVEYQDEFGESIVYKKETAE